jgi:predicted enzyme related to lactoylglutathione lyase
MPVLPPPVSDERDGLGAFLAHQQAAFRALVHGVGETDARATPTASAISLAWLVKHVTVVQRHWLTGALRAPDPLTPQDYSDGAQLTDEVLPDDTLPGLLAAYDEVCRDVLAAVATLDPDTRVPVPELPWFPTDVEHWSVRWVWLHLIQELARHAGHGDLIRETLDGATMYPLVAAVEGTAGPAWLQAWSPSEPPVVTGVSTVTLAATDVTAARDWYAAALGQPVDFENPFYAEFSLGRQRHEFGIVSAQFTDGPVVYLWVPELAVALERFTGAGARIEHEPRDFTGEGRYLGAVLVDPFGNRLGLMQRPHPTRPAGHAR